jgi:hypothetical protein
MQICTGGFLQHKPQSLLNTEGGKKSKVRMRKMVSYIYLEPVDNVANQVQIHILNSYLRNICNKYRRNKKQITAAQPKQCSGHSHVLTLSLLLSFHDSTTRGVNLLKLSQFLGVCSVMCAKRSNCS